MGGGRCLHPHARAVVPIFATMMEIAWRCLSLPNRRLTIGLSPRNAMPVERDRREEGHAGLDLRPCHVVGKVFRAQQGFFVVERTCRAPMPRDR